MFVSAGVCTVNDSVSRRTVGRRRSPGSRRSGSVAFLWPDAHDVTRTPERRCRRRWLWRHHHPDRARRHRHTYSHVRVRVLYRPASPSGRRRTRVTTTDKDNSCVLFSPWRQVAVVVDSPRSNVIRNIIVVEITK